MVSMQLTKETIIFLCPFAGGLLTSVCDILSECRNCFFLIIFSSSVQPLRFLKSSYYDLILTI